MKVLIAVPSKGRIESITKQTWSWLQFVPYDVKIFVEPQEVNQYASVLPESNLSVLEASDKGLWYVKRAMRDYALENGYDLVFKVDDDVRGWAGRDRKRKTGQEAAQIVVEAIEHCVEAFKKYPEVDAIGFPYSHQMFEVKKWAGINSRLQTCYIVRPLAWAVGEEISCFEDFYSFVAIIANNHNTLRYGLAGFDCDVGKQKGGLQSEVLPDRKDEALREIEIFKKLWPIIEVREVEGKRWTHEPNLRGKFFGGKSLK